MGKLFVIGIGPGDLKHMTFEAREALESAEVVIGYKTYLDLIRPLLAGKEVVSSGMTGEVKRCREALELADAGKNVALVSGGDAGIYGMAGLVLELAGKFENVGAPLAAPMAVPTQVPEIVIIPGVSAVQAAAAVLGAPLMHDFAVISLSDLLTPWDTIERRLAAAAAADFVTVLYNPRSKGRTAQLHRARQVLMGSRAPSTPVGIVRNACRLGEEKVVTTLGTMNDAVVDMFSLVIIGNSQTFVDDRGRMVTPRGYQAKGTGRKTFFNLRPSTFNLHGRAVMFCGTASDVGKSVLVAGFCRILMKRGMSVAPFKSQNMALNSCVTPEGGEIGRAQAVQAEACGIPPHTDMNPILLKPNTDTGSQVIVQGKAVGNMDVGQYTAFKPAVFARVSESFARLGSRHDFIVIEGAGSIAEINLKSHDIANLKVAEMAGCPAILVADIDRGGVFAQIIGTMELLEPHERERIRGIVINKFRGDPSLLTPAIEFVEERTGVPVLGVVPYFSGFRIPDEDSVALTKKARGTRREALGKKLQIGVVRLSRISNFTDFDALESEPDVELRYIEEPSVVGLDALIIPGSKSTISDLCFLKETGLFEAIKAFGGVTVGICGGFQMLGRIVRDPHNLESHIPEAEGLGLLDAETVMLMNKETHQAQARLLPGGKAVAPGCAEMLTGYEIHMGETLVGRRARSFATIVSRSGKEVNIRDGAVSPDGRVFGTYLHGIFDNPRFRAAFLNRLRRWKGLEPAAIKEVQADPFDLLAAHLERHLDMEKLLSICGIENC
ncbi:MAG TPA: cobyric acid synthase [Geobacteraceae bacterium]|nr:cobyric acid synthase [Geobacteraceae bacterium]